MSVSEAPVILLAEDDDAARGLFQLFLESQGFRLIVARTGAEAFELYCRHKNRIALLISDVDMPVLNGIELFIKIHAVDPTVRGVFMSGRFDFETAERLRHLGVTHFLRKPFGPEEMLSVVRSLLPSNTGG
jgi:DNA-binding NtrC family response regulator